MRNAIEILDMRRENLDTCIRILEKTLSSDTIDFCEEVLNPKIEKIFTDPDQVAEAKYWFTKKQKYGINFHEYKVNDKTYWIELGLLSMYLSLYFYKVSTKDISMAREKSKQTIFTFSIDYEALDEH